MGLKYLFPGERKRKQILGLYRAFPQLNFLSSHEISQHCHMVLLLIPQDVVKNRSIVIEVLTKFLVAGNKTQDCYAMT
jgi:hypothetical protein